MYNVATKGPFRSSVVPLLSVLSCYSQFNDTATGRVPYGILKIFAIFTRKHLCWSLFGVFGVNFIKKRLQKRDFPVNITKLSRTLVLKNIWERLHLKQLF